MKKRMLLIFIVLNFSIALYGCSDPKYINLENKPHKGYYTELLYKAVKDNNYDFTMLDTNLYKNVIVKDEDKYILKSTIKSLTTNNFIDKPTDLKEKPMYKLFINQNSKKYVINIYSNNIISVFPWDGNFPEDFVDLKTVPDAYKLEQFCKYVYDK
ncbi:DOmain of unknown function [Clostridium cavendishii DSM 21758]|uniref:Lipoprotein n=1 Tax=Clostridium cavendishii DSM 21758 TaxID=1121302 RepID=A0A1M6EWB9_9CLOT|nr:DUF4883 family protein [Clostridium cavendishii]SHI89728.1 DOmain of unknown function [Clostridium cavendishii DSM 21758]